MEQNQFILYYLWSREKQAFRTRSGGWVTDIANAKPYRFPGHIKSSVSWCDETYLIVECTVTYPKSLMTQVRIS